jgi:hypothetical protein
VDGEDSANSMERKSSKVFFISNFFWDRIILRALLYEPVYISVLEIGYNVKLSNTAMPAIRRLSSLLVFLFSVRQVEALPIF